MSKLEKLIQQYCPDGVEYLRLDKVANVCRGTRVVKSQLSDTGYPVYQNCLTPMGYFERSNCNAGTTFVICGGAAGNVGYTDVDCWAADDCEFIIGSNQVINNRYIYYYLMTKQNYLLSKVRKASIPRLSPNIIKDLEIPVPPLPVQEEIVRILDTFTELQAELQAELQKRKQQYNYYRDNLLTNFNTEQNVKEYTLGELGTFTRGNGLQKKDFTREGIGCIHYGQIYTRFGAFADKTLTYVNRELASHLLQVEKGNLVIACTSENVEDICKSVAWLGEENICTGGHACVFRHNQNPKYISYFFQTEYFFNQKKKYTYGTKVKDIKPDSIAKIKIPLPSLKEQERIVSILDNLYTLTNDLTVGLPAEMEKRRQQYEFYRDKLLTFKRKEA